MKKNGKKVPNYKERLNRQYLPAQYNETGAFVVSRAEIVTESTRIGENIDVYEVPDEESVDVDTFEDLQYVENDPCRIKRLLFMLMAIINVV